MIFDVYVECAPRHMRGAAPNSAYGAQWTRAGPDADINAVCVETMLEITSLIIQLQSS